MTAYFVGSRRAGWPQSLEQRLYASGVDVFRSSIKSLAETVGRAGCSAIVLCCPDEECCAKVLDWARGWPSAVPVVILVEQTDFSHYYRLMADGAWGYFCLDESLDTIARGIARAARIAGRD